ncbi:MAG: aldose epimerase family protein [Spirochaetia bacterium]
MDITQRTWGRTREGDEIIQFSLASRSHVTVQLISYGATLSSVQFPDRRGVAGEVTLGFDTLEGYLNPHPYFGSTIGRVANRIGRGRFSLDGREYSLFCNDGRNHLHGGKKGFGRVAWSSASFLRDGMAGVTFSYASPDGEEGYPGNLDARVTYTLDESGTLEVAFEARTDKATPSNLCNHAYWNLKGDGAGDIKEHRLTLFAESYLPVDAELIPTGEIRAVKGAPHDFRREKTIGQDLEKAGGGYDHCFVLGTPAGGWRPVARVVEPTTGRAMEMSTTQPGVQLYSGHMLTPTVGRAGRRYERYGAFALETQGFPDAINQPAFPSVVLRPGQKSLEKMRIRFFTE